MALVKKDGTVLTELKPIRIRIVTGKVVKAKGKSARLTAPTVDGYQFMFWTSCYTTGWIASMYAQEPQSQSSNFWVVAINGSDSTANGDFGAIAVYCPAGFD